MMMMMMMMMIVCSTPFTYTMDENNGALQKLTKWLLVVNVTSAVDEM